MARAARRPATARPRGTGTRSSAWPTTRGATRPRRRGRAGCQTERGHDFRELLRRPRRARGRRAHLRDLPARRAAAELRRRAPAVLPQGPAREPAAQRGRRRRAPRGRRGARHVGRQGRARRRRSPSRRRAWSCRTSRACRASSTSPRCATRWPTWAATRRTSTRSCPSSWSSTTPSRSTRSARARVPDQRGARSSSATRSATRSCAGARRRSRASRSCRRTPASCTRSTSSTSRASCSTTTDVLYPDTLVGTDSHTTMINGLGVLGWGVGGIEAEAAMLGQPMSMLIPRVVGFKLGGRAARGRHGDRPRAHRHADAARARRGGQVRRVLRAGHPEPAAGRPRDDRQHVAGVRLDVRDLPDRRGDAALPRVLRPRAPSRSSASRPTRAPRACGTTSTPRSRPTPRRSSSTSATSCPRSPARSARRTASR